jgi:hypothetical protein
MSGCVCVSAMPPNNELKKENNYVHKAKGTLKCFMKDVVFLGVDGVHLRLDTFVVPRWPTQLCFRREMPKEVVKSQLENMGTIEIYRFEKMLSSVEDIYFLILIIAARESSMTKFPMTMTNQLD